MNICMLGVCIDSAPVIFALLMMLFDIVSGLLKGFCTYSLSSTVMREGLIHKAVYILIILLFALFEVAQHYFVMGLDIPTTLAACIYIITAELLSVLENMVAIAPEIGEWPIIKQLMGLDVDDSSNKEYRD